MRPRHYILKNKNPEPAELLEWAKWFETGEHRRVRQTIISGKYNVSTVFLGLDHSYTGPPAIFETMVFGNNKFDQYLRRYATWEEAEQGHIDILKMLLEYEVKKENFDSAIEINNEILRSNS